MSHRTFRRAAAMLALVACAIAPRAARAQGPRGYGEPAKPAVKDTSRFLPNWLHLHAAIGVGWLASPLQVRQLYQAGQGYELGLEARPASDWRVRLNAEYQALPVVIDGTFAITGPPDIDGQVPVDTLKLEGQGQGWIGSTRLEAQKALIPGFWVLGGIGGGYINSGLENVTVLGTQFSFAGILPGSSGWTLMPTLGAIVESGFLGPTLALEVRWTDLLRPDNQLQTWSIRVGWSGY